MGVNRCLLAVALFSACRFAPPCAAADRPNIVFILADDLGYGDIGVYGVPDARTPNLDRLASQGVRFTQFYGGGPECTPSRTALLTGRYPERIGGMECAIGIGNVGRYDHAINLARRHELGLPAENAVLAPGLKHAGYVTGVFGKWHLGYDAHFNPLRQGFDHFWGFLGGFVDNFTHRELSPLPVLFRNEKPVTAEGYMTELITDETIAFITRERTRPFFAYVAYGAPHFPFQGPDDAAKPPPKTMAEAQAGTRKTYVAMIESLDHGVGRILATLDQAGIAQDTIVVFTSDHGAMPPGRNAPFSRGKTTLFEGGLRVPAIVRWPEKIKPGALSRQPAWMMDFTASLLRAAGAKPPAGGALDGVDILRWVEQGEPDRKRTFYWRFRREAVTWLGILDGDEKYIRLKDGAQVTEWLFDVAADPEESYDLAARRPEAVTRLKRALEVWEAEVFAVRGRN